MSNTGLWVLPVLAPIELDVQLHVVKLYCPVRE